jgi:8-oxo-dGTP pyrophosphatase MutT (NUDIX family)
VVTLIVLKLTGVITWSWWWVLSPLWISGVLLVLGLCALLAGLRWHARRRTRMWVDQFRSEWFREFVAGKADPDGGDKHQAGTDG